MSPDKILSNIKSLDEKIAQKETELTILKAKRDKAKTDYFTNLMLENNLSIDDVGELFGGTNNKANKENERNEEIESVTSQKENI